MMSTPSRRRVASRDIGRPAERELWARAAGRCEFDGCNRVLFLSPVTKERVNISEKAHIYAFSKDGTRGHGRWSPKKLNDIKNLILVCHDCHKKIDADRQVLRYPASRLQSWKADHERRISIVTGVGPKKKSVVVLYGANIGEQNSKVQPDAANEAIFPGRYPAEEYPVSLSMSWEGRDSKSDYWRTESTNLKQAFNQTLRPMLSRPESRHLSLFALAPMPLLTLLGSLLSDQRDVDVYQLHREPHQTWKWHTGPRKFEFKITRPSDFRHPPALVLALSDHISHSRITDVLGRKVAIWELTIDSPNNDFLKSKEQLSLFRQTSRQLIVEIGKEHAKNAPIAIFPAMPVACAVELGRIRMPKADSRWMIFDYNNKHGKFVHALDIGGTDNE